MAALFVMGVASTAAAGGAAPPATLIGTVTLGPPTSLDGVRAFANAVQPGAGAAVSQQMIDMQGARMVGASSLEGLDASSPEYFLIVADKPISIAVIGKIADDKLLTADTASTTVSRKGGWAVIGAKSAVAKVGPWALANLPSQPAPTAITATIYVPTLLARYKAELTKARADMSAQIKTSPNPEMMQSFFDGFFGALAETAEVRVTVDASAADAALDVALVPRAGSRLGKFIATQHPSDYALLADLPDDPAMIVAAGHLENGPYRAGMLELMSEMYAHGLPKDLIASIDAIMKASTADMAMSMRFAPGKGMAMAQVFGLADKKAADAAFAKVFAAIGKSRTFSSMGFTATLTANPTPVDHDGVTLRSYDTTYDFSKAPADQRATMQAMLGAGGLRTVYATFDTLGVSVLAPDGEAMAGRTIDAARGKGRHYAPSKEIGDLLTASRDRKESFAAVLDFASFASVMGMPSTTKLSGALLISAGFADQNAHLRFTLTASAAKSFAMRKP